MSPQTVEFVHKPHRVFGGITNLSNGVLIFSEVCLREHGIIEIIGRCIEEISDTIAAPASKPSSRFPPEAPEGPRRLPDGCSEWLPSGNTNGATQAQCRRAAQSAPVNPINQKLGIRGLDFTSSIISRERVHRILRFSSTVCRFYGFVSKLKVPSRPCNWNKVTLPPATFVSVSCI